MTSGVRDDNTPHYNRDFLLSVAKRNQIIDLWEVENVGRDRLGDPDAVSLYGMRPGEWHARGERYPIAAPIVEAFDERERRNARLGLRLEAVPPEKLAFEGNEEALAHSVVVGVADRAHRGTHACLTAALAELDRGTLVGVVDHAHGPPRRERHVHSIQHQLLDECRGVSVDAR